MRERERGSRSQSLATPTYVESLKVTLLPEQLTAVERISEHAVWIPKLKHTHTRPKPHMPRFPTWLGWAYKCPAITTGRSLQIHATSLDCARLRRAAGGKR